MFSGAPEMLHLLALSTLLCVALYQDARYRRIPNTLVLAGALTGMGLALAPAGLGVTSSMAGGMVGLLGFGLLYALQFLGAGDVKLIAAVGCFVGFPAIVQVALCILLMGGLLAFAWGAWTAQLVPALLNLRSRVSRWRTKAPDTSTEDLHHKQMQVPYAIAIAAGTWLHMASPWTPI